MASHVLVIDPERGFGGLIRDTLENLPGLQATLAESEAQALSALQDEDLSLIIVDFSSANLDASDLIGRFQKAQPDLVVIGLPQDTARNACQQAGLEIDGFLPLPFYLPDVAQLVAQMLDLPLDSQDVQPGRLAAGGAPEPGAESASIWLRDAASAQAQLNRSFGETSARAAMLTLANGDNAICGDLTQGQMANLQAMIGHQSSAKSQRGALARYVDLPDSGESHLLFSTVIRSGVALSLVYPAGVPFGTARRDARRLTQHLLHEDPERDLPSPQTEEGPGDSIPSTSPPAEALQTFEETILDGMDLPPPEPEHDHDRSIAPAGVPPAPVGRATEVHLPTSDSGVRNEQKPTGETTQASNRSSVAQISTDPEVGATSTFTVVLIPRLAEHRLTGSLGQTALEAVSELCQSRSWLQREVQLDERYLRFTFQLPSDRSPTGAVQELRRATSRILLKRLPELATNMPTRQFWNRRYLLQPGTTVDPRRIAALMEKAYA